MMAWVAATGGVRAIGESGEVTIETTDWQEVGAGPALGQPTDDCVTGTVTSLSIPADEARLTDADGRREYGLAGGAVVDRGEYCLECHLATGGCGDGATERVADTDLEASLRFSGPAKVTVDSETVSLRFPSPTAVTLGFSETSETETTITVPRTPEGVATAVTHLSAALETTGPERSHPSFRNRPPLVELGDGYDVPEQVVAATPETGIEFRVPPSYEYVLVGAPLAYYLGADMVVEEGTVPMLVAPSANVRCRLRELPTFQQGVARLLRQVFYLDTITRSGDVPSQRDQLAAQFNLDPERVRSLSPAARLARYFWVNETDLSEQLPEWHFSTYAAPDVDNARCLPYLLDALSLVYLPESSELRGTELLERTLDDFYRGDDGNGVRASSDTNRRAVQSVDMVKPELQAGRVHAWLAPGAPIDAFKTTTKAYENRLQYTDRTGTPLSVTVVLNDQEMADEHAAVADIYRERSADLPLSVTVEEHLTTDELRDVFASPNDLVHYIGHCDVDGLECPDGNFSASSLEECRTRTFFLNACGSYHEGLDLVDRGSVGGAVTLTKVLDRQAAKVGTAFARLLVHGFGLEPAMQLSRRRIMMGKDYAVVGDGTYTLAPTPGSPTVGWLEATESGYRLTCEALTARRTGDNYQPPFSDESFLHGTATETALDRQELVETLADAQCPIIYDNEFHWSSDLATRLARE
jgi:hypothetical protein